MAYPSPPPPPLRPAAPSPSRPPPPPTPHHDTTLTLALALPPPRLTTSARPPQGARRPRPDGGAAALASVRSSPTRDTPPCTECGKRFLSWKALFGHMRCHPERQWRGITPPPHFRHSAAGAAAAAGHHHFTVLEREVADSLLMLAGGARPGGGKGKKSVLSAWPSAKESCGASTSFAPAPARCGDHKCSVCARGFATGQALGGHKRCHWERACAGMAVVAASGSCNAPATSSETAETSTATALDLNLPPPGSPLPPKKDPGGSLNTMLDLKFGF